MGADREAAGGAVRRPGSHLLHRLPNGLTVACLNKPEVDFVYKEIFESQIYLKHGIRIGDSDCVFDIGANIGLFTLFVKQLRPRATVYAFEPSPELSELLRINTTSYVDSVRRFQCGVSNEDREATFTFYPGYTILSGFHADPEQDRVMLRSSLRNQFRGKFGDKVDPEDRHLDSLIDEMLRSKRESFCRVRRLSGIIEEHGVTRIDLLKIDAEQSELEILRGIEERDWEKFSQVVMEVHDPDGSRLSQIQSLLGFRDFRTVSEEEPQFRNAGIFNVYAMR